MKKYYFLITITILSTFTDIRCQDFINCNRYECLKEAFENPDKYLKGKIVSPKIYKKKFQKNHYQNFFSAFDKAKYKISNLKPFPIQNKNRTVSDYKRLVGKHFKVVDVYMFEDKNYKVKYYLDVIVNI